MTGFTEVQTILDTAVAAVQGVPTITTENKPSDTEAVTSFTRTELAPATTIAEGLGVVGADRLTGTYVIQMFYPKDLGVVDSNANVDALTVAFQSGTIFIDGANKVEIFNSWPNPATPDLNKFYRKQVVVEWRARRTRTL